MQRPCAAIVPDPHPHHRFKVQGRYGNTRFSVDATLAAPWTVLFGPSGSGKSTLLRVLAGLVPELTASFERRSPDAWQDLTTLRPEHRLLALDPQGAPLLPHLNIADNIRFPETLRHTSRQASQLPALTELLALAPLLTKRPAQLSGGERQRVSLARALAVPDARLLLLDEPFAGLDRARRDNLLPRLRAHLSARNLPVLSVTHDPDEALLLEAEILRLHNGQLAAQGPARLVLQDEIERLCQIVSPSSRTGS